MLTNLYILSDKCWHNLGISAYLNCAHATGGNEVVGISALEFLGQRAARVHEEQLDDDVDEDTEHAKPDGEDDTCPREVMNTLLIQPKPEICIITKRSWSVVE
jgi:hypothetical protein